MDSFWDKALKEGDTANEPEASERTIRNVEAPSSVVPVVAAEAESRLRTERIDRSARERWIQAFVVALVVGCLTAILLWIWSPAGLACPKRRPYDVATPSLSKIMAVSLPAAAAGFAIGWFAA